ncbi:hypothetical protein [Pseudaestuariivita rosea]|uniref:hypothetical protein n=1 Tax=Pseudaestuariivita rosea TaxID=2763263 RepID=UPI001ABB82E6|nr:hypothetical protein [Pseudaestuariivita rosea]
MTTASPRMPVSSYIWVGIIALVVLFEIILFFGSDPDKTFSTIMRSWAVVGLAAPFGWGTLAGHFFHPSDSWKGIWQSVFGVGSFWVIIVTAGLILLLAGVDVIVALATDGFVYPDIVSPIMLLVGFVWGAVSWPV